MPTNDLRSFQRRMKALGKRLDESAAKVTRRTVLAIDQAVVMATPVDTGRARSNWITAIGFRPEHTQEPYSPGEMGTTGGANAQAAIAQCAAAMGKYRKSEGPSIFITNNLPYIVPLNQGWSQQAPAGFVEEAIEAAVRAVHSARLLEG